MIDRYPTGNNLSTTCGSEDPKALEFDFYGPEKMSKIVRTSKKLNFHRRVPYDRCSFSDDFARHCSRFEGDPTEMHFLFAESAEGYSFKS